MSSDLERLAKLRRESDWRVVSSEISGPVEETQVTLGKPGEWTQQWPTEPGWWWFRWSQDADTEAVRMFSATGDELCAHIGAFGYTQSECEGALFHPMDQPPEVEP